VSRDPGLKGLKAGVSAILWEGCKPLPKASSQTGLKAGCGQLLLLLRPQAEGVVSMAHLVFAFAGRHQVLPTGREPGALIESVD
jgi:hypothetical protein